MEINGVLNVNGNLTGTLTFGQVAKEITLQDKTVTLGDQQQVIEADAGYDGLGEVTIPAVALENKTVTPTSSQQTITAGEGYDGLGTVTVEPASGGDDDLALFCSDTRQSLTITALQGKPNFRGFGSGGSLTLSGFTGIWQAACYYMQGLDKVFLPDVTVIAGQAFQNCVLSMVDIGPNITQIGADAFKSCINLKDMYIRSSTVPTLGSSSSIPIGIQRIHVKTGMASQFEADSTWSVFNGKFVEDID